MTERSAPAGIVARIATLRAQIEQANHCYHVLDDPQITDAQGGRAGARRLCRSAARHCDVVAGQRLRATCRRWSA